MWKKRKKDENLLKIREDDKQITRESSEQAVPIPSYERMENEPDSSLSAF